MSAPVGILLAAGASSRFGAAKLLQPLPDGVPVGVAAARTLLAAVPRTIAVVRPGDNALHDAFAALGMQVVINHQAADGMATSLAAGVNAAADADGWLIALADMPWVQPATLVALVERLQAGAALVAPVYQGQRGNPVGFAARWRDALAALSGDRGARDLLARHADELLLLDCGDAGVLADIDHPADLPRLSTEGR